MTQDPRCCGTGTCIINPDGECWCGQKWDGLKMAYPPLLPTQSHPQPHPQPQLQPQPGAEPTADTDDA